MDQKYARELWASQRRRTLTIGGRELKRIPYGREGRGWGYATVPCHDCGARRGHLHGPGCDMEKCPACGTQLLTCGCVGETDGVPGS